MTDENVLELDVVATSYEEEYPSEVLAEAKNGAWGFSDIFKVIGWMRYLGIERGAFFVSKDRTGMDPASVHEKVSSLKMSFVHMGDFSDATGRFKHAGFPEIVDSIRMSVWRYSYWAERNLLKRLKAIARDDPYKEGPVAALNHHRLVNDLIFFTKNLRERLSLLYTAYSRHPRLACGIATEMAGGKFDPEMYDPDNRLIKQAMYSGQYDQIQACFYLEHRARLAILKTAVDYECLVRTGRISAASSTSFDPLPTSLKDGIERIRKERCFKLYPLFWQVFLWGFGGFYLEDRKEAEFKWLSEQTGVPADEVPRALEVFNVLFPLSGS